MRAVLVSMILLAGALAGCLGDGGRRGLDAVVEEPRLDVVVPDVQAALERLLGLREEPVLLETEVTIHVVLSGFAEGVLDEERIRQQLPAQYSPRMSWSREQPEGYNSPIMLRLRYEFHEAPDAFGRDLFAYALQHSREVPGSDFLQQYDDDYGFDRLGSGGTIRLLDAEKVERWIGENRTQYGLAFPKPSYALFYFDTWTSGHMPREKYYHYEAPNVLFPGASSQSLRGWGGNYDFLFLDFGAAPNNNGNDNSNYVTVPITGGLSQGAPAREGTAYNDPPMWHYDGKAKTTIGQAPRPQAARNINDVIARDTDVGVNIRMIDSYSSRPVYKPVYYVNMHLWHDGRSLHPKDLENHVDAARWLDQLQREMPWATVTGSVKTYVLPDDDPGMDRALNLAKAQGAGGYIPIDPIARHVDANKERYVNQGSDVFNVRALLFILEGAYTFYLPAVVGGVAFGDSDGQAWGTISSVNDAQNLRTSASTKDRFARINTHEVGHFFGLTHAHDGVRVLPNGTYESFLDHTWSQTATVMSYRLTPYTSDNFDRDLIARAHTAEIVDLALRNVESTYRSLDAMGVERAPRAVAGPLTATEESLNTAIALFERGEFIDAVYAAIAGLDHSKRAVQAAGGVRLVERLVDSWDTAGVNHAGYKHALLGSTLTAEAPGLVKDYRAVPIDRDTEAVRIRVTWTNVPASWGDFFVGWDTDWRGSNTFYGVPVPQLGVVHFEPRGVHDDADEGPLDGLVVREHVLDLQKFPRLYDAGSIVAGAGVQGDAVNGAYQVEVFVTKRVHGPEDAGPPSDAAAESPSEDGQSLPLPRLPTTPR